jgi:hypothetical protein
MDDINIGDRVRVGVYVMNEWRPMQVGIVVSKSSDGTLADVDIMGLHGGRPWVNTERVNHLRKEPPPNQVKE